MADESKTTREFFSEYNVLEDKHCVLTFGASVKVKGINDDPEKTIALSWTHRKTPLATDVPMVRIMGQFDTARDGQVFSAFCKQKCPELSFVRVPLCHPVLVSEQYHAMGSEYVQEAINDTLFQHTMKMAEQHTEAERMFKERGAPDMSEETKKEEAAAAGSAPKELPEVVEGVSTVPQSLKSITPNHTIAAVTIVVDKRKNPPEPVVFPLRTFADKEEYKAWALKAHRHMRRYRIDPVPVWEWWNPMEVLEKNNKMLYTNEFMQNVRNILDHQDKMVENLPDESEVDVSEGEYDLAAVLEEASAAAAEEIAGDAS